MDAQLPLSLTYSQCWNEASTATPQSNYTLEEYVPFFFGQHYVKHALRFNAPTYMAAKELQLWTGDFLVAFSPSAASSRLVLV